MVSTWWALMFRGIWVFALQGDVDGGKKGRDVHGTSRWERPPSLKWLPLNPPSSYSYHTNYQLCPGQEKGSKWGKGERRKGRVEEIGRQGQGGVGAGWTLVSLKTEAHELFGKNMVSVEQNLARALEDASTSGNWGWFSCHKPWIEGYFLMWPHLWNAGPTALPAFSDGNR